MKFMTAELEIFKQTEIVGKDLTIFCLEEFNGFKLNCKYDEALNSFKIG